MSSGQHEAKTASVCSVNAPNHTAHRNACPLRRINQFAVKVKEQERAVIDGERIAGRFKMNGILRLAMP